MKNYWLKSFLAGVFASAAAQALVPNAQTPVALAVYLVLFALSVVAVYLDFSAMRKLEEDNAKFKAAFDEVGKDVEHILHDLHAIQDYLSGESGGLDDEESEEPRKLKKQVN